MKSALWISVAFVLAACTGPGADEPAADPAPVESAASYSPIVFEGQTATEAEREACLAAGGEIVPSGKLQWENCVQTFADAGKACASESDCIGECRYEGEEVEPGTEVAGQCQATDAKFGCRTVVHDGKILHTLCVD